MFQEKTKTAKAVLETAIGLDSIKEDANLIHKTAIGLDLAFKNVKKNMIKFN